MTTRYVSTSRTLARLQLGVMACAALAGPLILTQIAFVGLSVTDTLMAGQLSARDLAAVALGSALWMPTYLFFMGVCMAVSPIVSHLTGAKACEQLGSYIRRTLLLAAALSAVWWWLLRSADLIVLRLDVSSAIQDLSLAYLHALA